MKNKQRCAGLGIGLLRRDVAGLTVFDTLLVCILIAGLMEVMMTYYGRLNQEAMETALRTGLRNIRLSIELYHMVNGRYPEDLKELLSRRFLMPTAKGTIFNDQYLRAQALDASGYPMDPFGQRYQYHSALGRVYSGTERYQNW